MAEAGIRESFSGALVDWQICLSCWLGTKSKTSPLPWYWTCELVQVFEVALRSQGLLLSLRNLQLRIRIERSSSYFQCWETLLWDEFKQFWADTYRELSRHSRLFCCYIELLASIRGRRICSKLQSALYNFWRWSGGRLQIIGYWGWHKCSCTNDFFNGVHFVCTVDWWVPCLFIKDARTQRSWRLRYAWGKRQGLKATFEKENSAHASVTTSLGCCLLSNDLHWSQNIRYFCSYPARDCWFGQIWSTRFIL